MGERILIVDDDAAMGELLVRALSSLGYEPSFVLDARSALHQLDQADFDVVITDVRMRGGDGLTLCRDIVARDRDIAVIVMTAFGSMETAIEAIRSGAYDFVTKPCDLDVMRLAVRRACERRGLQRKVERLEHALRREGSFEGMVGSSPVIRDLFELVVRVAPTDATALLEGESGTGKEMVARAIHRLSRRAAGPFVAINCAAMPEALLESELFGHERGAFTDARTARTGLFQQADGGTLFLDEVAELPLALQSKLLRALQERTVRPVGASAEVPFDARIVSATNQDLETRVVDGRFRQDLYYRIQVVQLDVPPLRVRGNDILALADHFIEHFALALRRKLLGMEPDVAERLMAYSWPGNVRELRNCIERAVVLSRGERIAAADLPDKVRQALQDAPTRDAIDDLVPMDEVERRHVLRVFEAAGRNKSVTARLLGVDRKTLYRKLHRYGMLPEESEGD